MTELTPTIIAADEAEGIMIADAVAVLSIDPQARQQDVWAFMFAALDRAIQAHRPPD